MRHDLIEDMIKFCIQEVLDNCPAEMEFFLENTDGVVPVEVKAGRKASKSLANLLKKEDLPNDFPTPEFNFEMQTIKPEFQFAPYAEYL